jgi:hypothetical protein
MQDAGSAPVPFGKYLLDAELARGGMSRVWRARLRGPGGFEKQLVVKQILPQLAQDPSFVELLVQEANTLVRMSHPNIVPVYELGIVDGVYFLAMERVRGATVADLLRQRALPAAQVAELGAQVAEALRYAHERFELVHRDVTPRNVMVDADGHVRLLDFGIAAPSARTGKGELFGSPGYMSPEQAARKALTPASDLYGLGALLSEALTGKRAVVAGVATRLGADGGFDAELSALIDELLEVEPTARGSAARVVSRLRAWLAQKQPEGAREALGKRVDEVRARAERAAAAEGAQAVSDQASEPARNEADAAELVRRDADADTTGATPGVTRSIATSVTLTEMLATSATEPLPEAAGMVQTRAPRGRALAFAAVAVMAATSVGAWLALAPPARRSDPPSAANARATSPPAIPAPLAPRATPSSSPEPGATQTQLGEPAEAPPASAARLPAEATNAAAHHAAVGTPSPPVPSAEPPATLTIHATPWAEARLDGKALGPTPHRALRVRAGNHVLTLDCPPLGKKARVALRLTAGAHAQVVANMQAEPPSVSVR